MDFSVYAPDVRFTDPMTSLRGRLAYRGMIWTIALLARVLFVPATVTFTLAEDPRVVDDGGDDGSGYVLTRYATSGKTRWAGAATPPLVISGVDKFHLSPATRRICWHESAWDQTPAQVKDAFFRRD